MRRAGLQFWHPLGLISALNKKQRIFFKAYYRDYRASCISRDPLDSLLCEEEEQEEGKSFSTRSCEFHLLPPSFASWLSRQGLRPFRALVSYLMTCLHQQEQFLVHGPPTSLGLDDTHSLNVNQHKKYHYSGQTHGHLQSQHSHLASSGLLGVSSNSPLDLSIQTGQLTQPPISNNQKHQHHFPFSRMFSQPIDAGGPEVGSTGLLQRMALLGTQSAATSRSRSSKAVSASVSGSNGHLGLVSGPHASSSSPSSLPHTRLVMPTAGVLRIELIRDCTEGLLSSSMASCHGPQMTSNSTSSSISSCHTSSFLGRNSRRSSGLGSVSEFAPGTSSGSASSAGLGSSSTNPSSKSGSVGLGYWSSIPTSLPLRISSLTNVQCLERILAQRNYIHSLMDNYSPLSYEPLHQASSALAGGTYSTPTYYEDPLEFDLCDLSATVQPTSNYASSDSFNNDGDGDEDDELEVDDREREDLEQHRILVQDKSGKTVTAKFSDPDVEGIGDEASQFMVHSYDGFVPQDDSGMPLFEMPHLGGGVISSISRATLSLRRSGGSAVSSFRKSDFDSKRNSPHSASSVTASSGSSHHHYRQSMFGRSRRLSSRQAATQRTVGHHGRHSDSSIATHTDRIHTIGLSDNDDYEEDVNDTVDQPACDDDNDDADSLIGVDAMISGQKYNSSRHLGDPLVTSSASTLSVASSRCTGGTAFSLDHSDLTGTMDSLSTLIGLEDSVESPGRHSVDKDAETGLITTSSCGRSTYLQQEQVLESKSVSETGLFQSCSSSFANNTNTEHEEEQNEVMKVIQGQLSQENEIETPDIPAYNKTEGSAEDKDEDPATPVAIWHRKQVSQGRRFVFTRAAGGTSSAFSSPMHQSVCVSSGNANYHGQVTTGVTANALAGLNENSISNAEGRSGSHNLNGGSGGNMLQRSLRGFLQRRSAHLVSPLSSTPGAVSGIIETNEMTSSASVSRGSGRTDAMVLGVPSAGSSGFYSAASSSVSSSSGGVGEVCHQGQPKKQNHRQLRRRASAVINTNETDSTSPGFSNSLVASTGLATRSSRRRGPVSVVSSLSLIGSCSPAACTTVPSTAATATTGKSQAKLHQQQVAAMTTRNSESTNTGPSAFTGSTRQRRSKGSSLLAAFGAIATGTSLSNASVSGSSSVVNQTSDSQVASSSQTGSSVLRVGRLSSSLVQAVSASTGLMPSEVTGSRAAQSNRNRGQHGNYNHHSSHQHQHQTLHYPHQHQQQQDQPMNTGSSAMAQSQMRLSPVFYLGGHRLPPDLPLFAAIKQFSPVLTQHLAENRLSEMRDRTQKRSSEKAEAKYIEADVEGEADNDNLEDEGCEMIDQLKENQV
ncbi:unnamed protein product [Protopolystoma xenopodis]|uniref:Uncharacterized protein n=1 Tax=Protopolystoma xenopodis TaxID=117903 RepID=A0A448XCS9_9PLAT|nr:unnamed protein product [Protopolystoma xenopodis]